MLERISSIRSVGLFNDANGKPYTLRKGTLVYGENGSGKSTLTTIFRSLALNDPELILRAKTIDATQPPKVDLQFESGKTVGFDGTAWSAKRPDVHIFDNSFIDRNVHSGGVVETDHRRRLLEFALGSSAVTARSKVESTTTVARAASESEQALVSKLSGHHTGISLAQFEKLAAIPDIDQEISNCQAQIVAAANLGTILAKPLPEPVALPALASTDLLSIAAVGMDGLQEAATGLVQQHISTLGPSGATWVSDGTRLCTSDTCPFCAQSITDNELVTAYKTYFNEAYNGLKANIRNALRVIETRFSTTIVDALRNRVELASAHATSWSEHVQISSITFDAVQATELVEQMRASLHELLVAKAASPSEPQETSELADKMASLSTQLESLLAATNAQIEVARKAIDGFKMGIAAQPMSELQQRLQTLNTTKRRFAPEVQKLLLELGNAKKAAAAAEQAKRDAREDLDKVMAATLDKYQSRVNALLTKFGATFRICRLGGNFRGAAPRTEYAIELRGKPIALDGSGPNFTTALSEGDKRTLAFAFFLACVEQDPNLKDSIVIIDDPVCSLDNNRRTQTIVQLRKLYSSSQQLIVLAHDPFFLRSLRDGLEKEDKPNSPAILRISPAPGNYSTFSKADIDSECESAYLKHHRLVENYSTGSGGSPELVAKSIRPLMEGYLHRRFPGKIPRDLLFGQIIALIKTAPPTSALYRARGVVSELEEINSYAGQFHHDTNPDASTVTISGPELATYSKRVMAVIHGPS